VVSLLPRLLALILKFGLFLREHPDVLDIAKRLWHRFGLSGDKLAGLHRRHAGEIVRTIVGQNPSSFDCHENLTPPAAE
jgi:hypothetical protein